MGIPYNSGWSAKVDGQKVKLYKANYGFMACYLKEGQHQIELRYVTPGIRVGIFCTILSIVLMSAWCIGIKRNKKLC